MSDEEIEARLRRLFAAERASAAETEAVERVGDFAAAVASSATTERVRRPGRLVAAAVALALVSAGVVAITLAMRSGAPGRGAPGTAGAPAPTGSPRSVVIASALPAISPSVPSTASLVLRQVRMIDDLHGWALNDPLKGAGDVSPVVLVTGDGGHSWTDVTPPPVARRGVAATDLVTMTARSSADAWIVAAGMVTSLEAANTPGVGIFHTTDGGRSWTRSTVGHGTGAVTVVTAQVAYYVEHDREVLGSDAETLWQTTDAGATWRFVSGPGAGSGIPLACDKSDAGWRDPENGWIGGGCPFGGILFDVTHDGGVHWAVQRFVVPPGVDATGKGFSIDQPVFLTAKDGYADAIQVVPESTNPFYGSTSYLCATHDGGTTWTCSVAPPTAGLVEVVDTGYAVVILSDGTIESSRDDGRDWTAVGRPSPLSGRSDFVPQFLDRDTGFVLVFPPGINVSGVVGASILYRTTDGGRTLKLP